MKNLIESLMKILTGDGNEALLQVLADAANSVNDRVNVISNMQEFLSRFEDKTIAEQMANIIEELRNSIMHKIQERNLNLFDDFEQELDRKLEECEIAVDSRSNIKENLKCYILVTISENDPNFYNDLMLNSGLNRVENENAKQDSRIEKLSRQMQEIKEVVKEWKNISVSPFKVQSISPNIDNANKIIARDTEINEIQRAFENGSNVVFLYGRPGMGKTTLAKLYAKKRTLNCIRFE